MWIIGTVVVTILTLLTLFGKVVPHESRYILKNFSVIKPILGGQVIIFLLPIFYIIYSYFKMDRFWWSRFKIRKCSLTRDDCKIIEECAKRLNLPVIPHINSSGLEDRPSFVYQKRGSRPVLVLPNNFEELTWQAVRKEPKPKKVQEYLKKFIIFHEFSHIKHGDIRFISWVIPFLQGCKYWLWLALANTLLTFTFMRFFPNKLLEIALANNLMFLLTYFLFYVMVTSAQRHSEFLADARAILHLSKPMVDSLLKPSSYEWAEKSTVLEAYFQFLRPYPVYETVSFRLRKKIMEFLQSVNCKITKIFEKIRTYFSTTHPPINRRLIAIKERIFFGRSRKYPTIEATLFVTFGTSVLMMLIAFPSNVAEFYFPLYSEAGLFFTYVLMTPLLVPMAIFPLVVFLGPVINSSAQVPSIRDIAQIGLRWLISYLAVLGSIFWWGLIPNLPYSNVRYIAGTNLEITFTYLLPGVLILALWFPNFLNYLRADSPKPYPKSTIREVVLTTSTFIIILLVLNLFSSFNVISRLDLLVFTFCSLITLGIYLISLKIVSKRFLISFNLFSVKDRVSYTLAISAVMCAIFIPSSALWFPIRIGVENEMFGGIFELLLFILLFIIFAFLYKEMSEISPRKLYYVAHVPKNLRSLSRKTKQSLAEKIIESKGIAGGFTNSTLFAALGTQKDTFFSLQILNRLGYTYENKKAITSWILSCQCKNGGFGPFVSTNPQLSSTYYALQSLRLLNHFQKADLRKHIKWLNAHRNNEGFFESSFRSKTSLPDTFYGLKSLEILGSNKDKVPSLKSLRKKWANQRKSISTVYYYLDCLQMIDLSDSELYVNDFKKAAYPLFKEYVTNINPKKHWKEVYYFRKLTEILGKNFVDNFYFLDEQALKSIKKMAKTREDKPQICKLSRFWPFRKHEK